MMHRLILAASVFTMLGLPACNPSDERNWERRSVPEGLKRDFLFNKGTYWIYAGVHSGTVDSVYIEEGPTEWRREEVPEAFVEHIQRTARIVRIVGVPNSNTLKDRSASLYGSTFSGMAWPLGAYPALEFSRIPQVLLQGNTFQEVGQSPGNGDTLLLKEHIGLLRVTYGNASGTPQIYELVRWHIVQ